MLSNLFCSYGLRYPNTPYKNTFYKHQLALYLLKSVTFFIEIKHEKYNYKLSPLNSITVIKTYFKSFLFFFFKSTACPSAPSKGSIGVCLIKKEKKKPTQQNNNLLLSLPKPQHPSGCSMSTPRCQVASKGSPRAC